MDIPKPPSPPPILTAKEAKPKLIPPQPNTPRKNSPILLLILTNILTALVVASIFYFGNIPSNRALEYAAKIQENYTIRNTNFPPPPTQYVYVEELNPQSTIKTDFSPNQYIIWTENNATYTIVGAEYGKFNLGNVPYNSLYKKGEEIYGLQFKMKLFTEKSDCIALPKLRLLNQSQDFIAPIERQFVFSTGGCAAQSFTTYVDKKLTFPVTEGDLVFNLTYPNNNQFGNFKLRIENNSITLQK